MNGVISVRLWLSRLGVGMTRPMRLVMRLVVMQVSGVAGTVMLKVSSMVSVEVMTLWWWLVV